MLWAAFAGTLILFVIRVLKMKAANLPPSIVPSQKPDLADEEIEADRLPDNEWYALARKKMAAGEFRQAQRALFLAILSYLASHRLITSSDGNRIPTMKKNSSGRPNISPNCPRLFAQSRLGFERCWYGADTVTPEDFDHYNGFTKGSNMRPPGIVRAAAWVVLIGGFCALLFFGWQTFRTRLETGDSFPEYSTFVRIPKD